jgi:DNA-binding transcriptional ArsR family regulator
MGQFIFTPNKIDALKKAVKQQKVANTTQAIQIVGELGAVAVSTIFAVSNAKERERMVESLAQLDEANLRELNSVLSRQSTNTERIRAYFDFFSRYRGEVEGKRISGTIGSIASEKSDREKRLMKIIFGGALALIIVAVVIKKIKK